MRLRLARTAAIATLLLHCGAALGEAIASGGATLPLPLYQEAIANFPTQAFLPYVATGGTAGLRAFLLNSGDAFGRTGPVHWVGSEAALTPAQITDYLVQGWGRQVDPASHGPLIQIPVAYVPITISYKGPSVPITLSSHQLCAIFSGAVDRWSQLGVTVSPSLDAFKLVYRADGSGTTGLLTRHLRTVCETSGPVRFVGKDVFREEFPPGPLPSHFVEANGDGGAAAAIYAARKGIRTGVAAERFGGQVLDTMGIENLVSVAETEGPKLAAALEQNVRQNDVDVMNGQRAAKLLPAGEDGLVRVELANGAVLKSRTVVLGTGARWRQMGVPGEDLYRNKGVAYCPHCDGPLFKGKRVAVIGGGNSGVEAAIDLAGIVSHVTLVEFDSKLRADEVLQRKLRSLANVTVLVNAQSTEVLGDGRKVNGLVYRDRVLGSEHRLELEGIFVQIGLLPNTEWLKGTVELSARGEIVIDERGQTSVPGVFAAGDATTVPYKQIVVAMGAGSTAALSAFDHLIRAPLEAVGGKLAAAA